MPQQRRLGYNDADESEIYYVKVAHNSNATFPFYTQQQVLNIAIIVISCNVALRCSHKL